MSSRKDSIRQRIAADHAACMALLNNFTAEQWEMPAPSDEGAQWKARDVLAHLAVSEGGQLGQIERCLQGEAPVPDDFDLTRFNRRSVQKQAEKSVADLLKEISRLRTSGERVVVRLPGGNKIPASGLGCDRELVKKSGRWSVENSK